MKPSVGRIVCLSYHGYREPAVVTRIDEDGLPTLRALGDVQVTVHHAEYAEESAESAAQPNTMTTPHMTWAWPPRV